MVSDLANDYNCTISWLHVRGGMKESGVGRENGIEALEACESR
jgi:hypothetical protein